MIRLYITRHGMTSWNEQGRLQGHSDSPLTRQGEEDAIALKKVMENYPIDAVYSSPLPRAYKTASLIFPDRTIIKDERIKEMGFGVAEGQFIKVLLEDPTYDNMWNHPEKFTRFENGESYQDVYVRLYSFLEDIKHREDEHVFIAIHGMLYVVLMSIFKCLDIKDLVTINRSIVRGGSLTIVDINEDSYSIVVEGKEDHLKKLDKQINFIKK